MKTRVTLVMINIFLLFVISLLKRNHTMMRKFSKATEILLEMKSSFTNLRWLFN